MLSLKQIRKDSGLKQNWVANRLNVTSQTIWNWEQGKTKPNAVQAAMLAELYHITLDELVRSFETNK